MASRYADIDLDEAKKLTNKELRAKLTKEQIDRLDMELSVLDNMGYNGYF